MADVHRLLQRVTLLLNNCDFTCHNVDMPVERKLRRVLENVSELFEIVEYLRKGA